MTRAPEHHHHQQRHRTHCFVTLHEALKDISNHTTISCWSLRRWGRQKQREILAIYSSPWDDIYLSWEWCWCCERENKKKFSICINFSLFSLLLLLAVILRMEMEKNIMRKCYSFEMENFRTFSPHFKFLKFLPSVPSWSCRTVVCGAPEEVEMMIKIRTTRWRERGLLVFHEIK